MVKSLKYLQSTLLRIRAASKGITLRSLVSQRMPPHAAGIEFQPIDPQIKTADFEKYLAWIFL